MARNEQLIRQHKILQILEDFRFGRTLEELRDELVSDLGLTSLHPRSVRRDLEALQAAGFDVAVQATPRGRVWRLGPRAKRTHSVTASATELIALSLGRDLLNPLRGTPFWQGIESFWNRIRDELPASVADHYDKYRRVLRVLGIPAKSYAAKQGMLKTLQRAILEHRVVDVDYAPPARAAARREIEPYAIVLYQSSLYIIAAAHELPAEADRLRHWKLDRFHRATLLDRWFTPDARFDLEAYLGASLGVFSGGTPKHFRIRVSARAAAWVLEDPWHPQQQVHPRRDGDVELSVPAAHELDIIPRVLALGPEAELLAPPSSRQEMARLIQAMAARYASGDA
ncbi:MAG: WYL domain-containing protein [Pirellulaceae bacterium]|jgi:predicted DNA-binding transcriptional regulator YafY|nr:WYL domain-containing protein [Pirellulaceae bacterium]